MTLIFGAVGFRSAVRALNVYLKKEPVPLRSHFDNIAAKLGAWDMVGQSQKLSVEMIEELGTDLYLDRRYLDTESRDGRWMSLHIAYYTGMIDAVPHVPDRCLVAGGFNARTTPANLPMTLRRRGWVEGPPSASGLRYPTVTFPDAITKAPVTVHLPLGEFAIRTTEFSHDDMPDRRVFAGYFFVANGRYAVTPEQVKLLAFRKSERFAYYCKIQFLTIGDKDFTVEDFVAQAARLTEELLPDLMRCLPDWPELEKTAAASRSEDS